MPRFTHSTLGRFSPRFRWWSVSSALLLSIGAALLLFIPVGEQATESTTAAVASSKAAAVSARTGGGIAELTKWEYVTVPLALHSTKQTLDLWGEDGWELVQVVPGQGSNGDTLVGYLKRPKFA